MIRFTNRAFKLYCKNNGMKLIHPFTHEKVNQIFKCPNFVGTALNLFLQAAFIERAHQTIQSILWSHISHTGSKKIIDILDDVVKTYNNRGHRMLAKKSPQFAEDNPNSSLIASYNKKYLDRVNKYKRRPKFKIGDKGVILQLGIKQKQSQATVSCMFLFEFCHRKIVTHIFRRIFRGCSTCKCLQFSFFNYSLSSSARY